MKRIIIVGAGGFGRELTCWIEQALDSSQAFLGGFIDDTIAAGDKLSEEYPYPVLGRIADYVPQAEDVLIVAIGNPSDKISVAESLRQRGAQFYNLIHPTAVIARTAKIGQGLIMCPYSMLSASSVIEDFVTLNSYTSIGHDAVVGEGTTMSSHVDITGYVKVGRKVFVGSNASILPKVVVGDGATIGAGSVVVRRVAEGSTVYAMPARKL
jgi:sugar O-acyltransferase (sialic acid O-acetyltransferase NeuD family)